MNDEVHCGRLKCVNTSQRLIIYLFGLYVRKLEFVFTLQNQKLYVNITVKHYILYSAHTRHHHSLQKEVTEVNILCQRGIFSYFRFN